MAQEKSWNPFPQEAQEARVEQRHLRGAPSGEQIGAPKFERTSLRGMTGHSGHVQERERWDPKVEQHRQMLNAARATGHYIEQMRDHASQPHMLAEELRPSQADGIELKPNIDEGTDYVQAA